MADKKLYRSKDNRVIGGVAGGIAEYLGLDPVIVRVVFVIWAIVPWFAGSAVLVYLILWLLVPEEGGKPIIEGSPKSKK